MKDTRLYAHLTSKKIPKRLEGRVWPRSDTSKVRLYWAYEESWDKIKKMSEKSSKIACQRVFNDINPVIFLWKGLELREGWKLEYIQYVYQDLCPPHESWVGQQQKKNMSNSWVSHDLILLQWTSSLNLMISYDYWHMYMYMYQCILCIHVWAFTKHYASNFRNL